MILVKALATGLAGLSLCMADISGTVTNIDILIVEAVDDMAKKYGKTHCFPA